MAKEHITFSERSSPPPVSILEPRARPPSLAEYQEHFDAFLARATRANKLVWLHFSAGWNTQYQQWRTDVFAKPVFRELEKEFCFFEWPCDVWPELDAAAQFLQQSLSGRPSGWPLHLFFEPASLKPVVGIPGLAAEAFESVLRRLLTQFHSEPRKVKADAEATAALAAARDPLAMVGDQLFADAKLGHQERAVATAFSLAEIESSYLRPLAQSIDYATGLFGNQTAFLYSAAYGTLLDTPASEFAQDFLNDPDTFSGNVQPNLGEIALSRLARGPLCDVIGGGFFRSLSLTSGELECEKLLHQNAEMLWVLTDAVVKTKSPFLEQVLAETMRTLAEDFFDEAAGIFSGALAGGQTRFEFSTFDLLDCVEPAARVGAQKFFGIGSQPTIPRLSCELPLLARELNCPPADLKNYLVESQKKMRLYRGLRPGLSRRDAQPWQIAFAMASLYRTMRLVPGLRQKKLAERLDLSYRGLDRDWQQPEASRRDFACQMLVAIERSRFDGGEDRRAIEGRFENFAAGFSAVDDLRVLGRRLAVYDHVGWSATGLQLMAIEAGLSSGLELAAPTKVRVGREFRRALASGRQLGIGALSVFWVGRKALLRPLLDL